MRHVIRLYHTNDLHSHMEEMERIHSFVVRKREEAELRDDSFLLVDLGDHADRFRMETEGTMGIANRKILDYTGYDIVTLGNNELLTISDIHLATMYHQSSFSVVSSNVRQKEDQGLPAWIRPWEIKEIRGVRIAFLGATIPYPLVYELLGWDVDDPMECIARDVALLRSQVDVIVVLSHLGIFWDRKMAMMIPDVDIIIGAHTHHLLAEPERIGTTMIVAAGKFGEYVGEVQIIVDPNTNNNLCFDACVHMMKIEEPSVEMAHFIHSLRLEAEHVMTRPIAQLEETLPISWNKESIFANLLADELRTWTGAPFSLVNSGVLLGPLVEGVVTWEKLHKLCPHPINPVLVEISGRAIREALEQSLEPSYQNKKIRGYGFRGKILGSLAISGLQVVTTRTVNEKQSIQAIYMGNEQLEDEYRYQLATIDMFTFGSGYVTLKESELLRYYVPEFLRDLLKDAIQDSSKMEKAKEKRWLSNVSFETDCGTLTDMN
ncbi:bifunctional UDP-sugar hydrolase/5'-nucleotidase [Thermoactinomyces sp. DSM 45892]|uniref:bifunctional metallophosphatase/5'-nucleotidase n=1 Tax=Thermoactinomyces sp. DSM 45892 TaxID=1882753 RepID=UPI0008993D1D|nr:bifunctional UDP-sugar hydrolase/5'-nucleotidase [Thermoactinomyces sp. DSM 45892]SDZ28930.1 2',3'-cyclic-nucleotide 2'-phosphodiesterase/5'-or 3'-nucleotidase, 5'-nucleotidase family [Thermoactinomyces sp. DSM 45892]